MQISQTCKRTIEKIEDYHQKLNMIKEDLNQLNEIILKIKNIEIPKDYLFTTITSEEEKKAREAIANHQDRTIKLEEIKKEIEKKQKSLTELKKPMLFGKKKHETDKLQLEKSLADLVQNANFAQIELDEVENDVKKAKYTINMLETEIQNNRYQYAFDCKAIEYRKYKIICSYEFEKWLLTRNECNEKENKNNMISCLQLLDKSLQNYEKEFDNFIKENDKLISNLAFGFLLYDINFDKVGFDDEIFRAILPSIISSFLAYCIADGTMLEENEKTFFSHKSTKSNFNKLKPYLGTEYEIVARNTLSAWIRSDISRKNGEDVALEMLKLFAQYEKIIKLANDDFIANEYDKFIKVTTKAAEEFLASYIEKGALEIIDGDFYVLGISKVPAKLSQFLLE